MKKLMVAAVAMAMAVVANAATTAWGIPYADIEADGNQFTGGTAFLYTFTDTAPSFDTAAGAWNLAGATLLTYANDNGDGTWGKFDVSSASKLADLSVTDGQKFAVVLTSAETADLASFVGADKYAAVVTGVAFQSQGFEEVGGAAFDYIDASYPDQVYASDWVNVAAVPEPTSGLLLLLGVAGLALRRRRA